MIALPATNQVAPMVSYPNPPSSALTPSKISSYYKFNALPKSATGATLDGTGQTIAIVNAYNNPTIASDLHTFSVQFGLPDANLTVVNQSGSGTSLPSTDTGWALETAMDVEWAHAIAPKANILLVEAASASLSDLMQAVKYASAHASVVSMSWGSSEFRTEQSYDSVFNTPGVTFVTASGDDAGSSGAEWPSSSPYVVSVGGTTLVAAMETAWSGSRSGSGGGISAYESLPSYQSSVVTARGRVTPDVAYVANPSTGVAVYTATAARGQSGWVTVGGTSAGSPQWAGLFALTNQLRVSAGQTPLNSNSALTMLYAAARTEGQSTPSTLFNDVTSGQNAKYKATTGYDAVTGLGSPIASNLVKYLSTGQLPAGTPTTSTPTAPSTIGGSSGGSGGWIVWFPWGGWRGSRFNVLGDSGFPVLDADTTSTLATTTFFVANDPTTSVTRPITTTTTTTTISADASRGQVGSKPIYYVIPRESLTSPLAPTGVSKVIEVKTIAQENRNLAKPNVIPTPITTEIKLRSNESTSAEEPALKLEPAVTPDLIPSEEGDFEAPADPAGEQLAGLLALLEEDGNPTDLAAETIDSSDPIHDQALAAITTGLAFGVWRLRARDRRKRGRASVSLV